MDYKIWRNELEKVFNAFKKNYYIGKVWKRVKNSADKFTNNCSPEAIKKLNEILKAEEDKKLRIKHPKTLDIDLDITTKWVIDFETGILSRDVISNKVLKTQIVLSHAKKFDLKTEYSTMSFEEQMKDIQKNESVLFRSVEELYNWIMSLRGDHLIYAHNISYDGTYLDSLFSKRIQYENFINNNHRKLKRYTVFHQGSKINSIFINNPVNLRLADGKRKWTFNKVKFLCSLRLIGKSVEQIGKDLGFSKHTQVFNNAEDKEKWYRKLDFNGFNSMSESEKEIWIEYIKSDVNITILGLINHYLNIKNYTVLKDYELGSSISISQNAMKQITKHLSINHGKSEKQNLKIKYSDWQFAYNFFSAGYTQFSSKHQFYTQHKKEKLTYIDRNQSYPAEMLNLPFGIPTKLKNKPTKLKKDKIYWLKVELKNIQIKKGFDNLPIMKTRKNDEHNDINQRYLKTQDLATRYYSLREYEFMKIWYDFEVVSEEYFEQETTNSWKFFIETNHEKRLKVKKSNPPEADVIKLSQNSLYGKMAQRAVFPRTVRYLEGDPILEDLQKAYDNDQNVFIDGIEFKVKSASRIFRKSDNSGKEFIEFTIEKILDSEDVCNNIWIAAYITSQARSALFENMVKIGVSKIAYSDTDSIIAYIPNEKLKLLNLDDHILGAWKIEYTDITDLGISAAKHYAFKGLTYPEKKEIIKTTMNVGKLNNAEDIYKYFNAKALFDGIEAPKLTTTKYITEGGLYFEKKPHTMKVGTQ